MWLETLHICMSGMNALSAFKMEYSRNADTKNLFIRLMLPGYSRLATLQYCLVTTASDLALNHYVQCNKLLIIPCHVAFGSRSIFLYSDFILNKNLLL